MKKIIDHIDARNDFSTSINVFEHIGQVLYQPQTIMTLPSVVIFSNNKTEGALDIIEASWQDNPSQYLIDNHDKTKSAKYVIVVPATDLKNITSQTQIDLYKIKYDKLIDKLLGHS